MRFKKRYKSCLWSRTNIWGNLLSKEKTFLRPKWDTIISILRSQRRRHRPLGKPKRYRHPICHDYKYLSPRLRSNQVFKYNRRGYRNTLSLLFCIRRFYGDLSHKSFKKFCRPFFKFKDPSLKLLGALEGRLDMCLYRLGFFHSIYYSGQAILHNKVLVNGKKIGYGGFVLQKGDYVEFCPTQREAIRARLVARYKRFRSKRARRDRKRLSHGHKLMLHLPPTPKYIQTDYSNLSFIVSSEVYVPVVFPFRANIDEAVWASKYGYL
uniref:Ribosomal protein S4 n=1 Tax=Pleurocladia lacustris TaxID=246121 RepID=A0A1I9LW85_9PHAE|nr:ribosomal protein S4 [Pleurocladia lacustris]ANS57813.1 ribosomal protein S4 [Pleurocladia lacustris]ANS57855.1 ribosomal protein S4 [Pleurocladia lacustris]